MGNTLFTPVELGNLYLKNRIAMAPMTRSRAVANMPNDIMAKYYAMRAEAGLIITEGLRLRPMASVMHEFRASSPRRRCRNGAR